MVKFIITIAIGASIGALMGYFGKCTDGQCPLTSTPWRGALWGGFLALAFGFQFLASSMQKALPESENIVKVNDNKDFKTIIADTAKVHLVDFYADWCGPCRMLSPTINKLADDYKETANVIKINVNKHKDIAKDYEVSSIPCIVIISEGNEVKRFTGANNYEKYAEELDSILKKGE